ncbi:Cu2+-containing amine oxidase [Pseudomonas sp. GM102]|nr:Cu2+-containing amine oxidase [Pseudomonas sp. GM102]
MGQPNLSTERRDLVVRWISTVGNYDYMAEAYSLGWSGGCMSFYLAKNR